MSLFKHRDSLPCQFDRGSRVLKLTAKRFAGRSDSGEVKALGEDRSISGQQVGCKGFVVGRLEARYWLHEDEAE
jgi:hypothetical protein